MTPLTAEQKELVSSVYNMCHWAVCKYTDKLPGKLKYSMYDDLVQEALLGAMKAANKYDPERGVFSSYAMWYIRQHIQIGLRYLASTELPMHLCLNRYSKKIHLRRKRAVSFRDPEIDVEKFWYTVKHLDESEDEAESLMMKLEASVKERWWHVFARRANGETLQSIADSLGVTKERVRQIEERAIRSFKASEAFKSYIEGLR